MRFEWDENKNKLNLEKHGVNFEDARFLFINGFWSIEDKRREYNERRFVGFGYVNNRLMCVVYVERKPNIIRIISFRKANEREVKLYENNIKN